MLSLAAAAGDGALGAELRRRVDEIVTFPGDPSRAEATRTWLRDQLKVNPPVAPTAP